MKPDSSKPAFKARRGREWVAEGAMIVRRQFIRLLILGVVLQFIGGFSQSSALGILFVLCMPAFSAGMLQAMHLSASGLRPPYLTLFAGFRGASRFVPLLLMGALILGLAMAAMAWALASVLPQLAPDILSRMEAGDTTAVLEIDPFILQRIIMGLAVGLFAGAAVSYFAVPLIWFSGLRLGRAMLTGLKALARQWRPFLYLGLILGLIGLPVIVLTAFGLSATALGQEPNIFISFVTLLGAVAYQLLLFSTQYVAFRDIFGTSQDAEPSQENAADQLVA